jgi:hypothetical protein
MPTYGSKTIAKSHAMAEPAGRRCLNSEMTNVSTRTLVTIDAAGCVKNQWFGGMAG